MPTATAAIVVLFPLLTPSRTVGKREGIVQLKLEMRRPGGKTYVRFQKLTEFKSKHVYPSGIIHIVY